MTRFKRIVSMFLVVIMVMSLLPLAVIAEDIQSTHTVSFKLTYNGAPNISRQKVADGELATEPKVSRTGYILEYWYTKSESGNEKFDFSQPVTEDLVLYAHWKQDIDYWGPIWNQKLLGEIENGKDDEEESSDGFYTVTFEANADGVVGMPENQKVAAGECAIEPDEPTKDEYIFGGWYSDSDTLVPFNFNTPIYSDTALYAKWILEFENDDPALYNITEVIFDEETGEIHFRTKTSRSCELYYYVVEDEETEILYESTIPAAENLNGEYITDTIPSGVLPIYYKIVAVLTDTTGKPLCDQYIYYEHTKVYIDFMAKTIFDFPSESVINLDTSYDNNFMVANKETDIFIHPEFSTKFDKDTNTYVFSGNISELDALSRGDQLAILTEDNAYALQVESLSVSENEITVKAYDEVNLAQFFDYVKINQEVDVSQTDIFPEQQLRKARAQLNASTDIPLPPIDIGKINIDIKVGIGVEFVLNFEKSSNFYEVKLSMNVAANGKVAGELKEWGDSVPEYRNIVPRFVVPLAIPGLAAESGTQLFFKKSAELAIETGLKIGMVFGYQCSSYGNKPIFEPVFEIDDPNINLSGAIEFGLSPYVGVTFLGGLITLAYNNDIGIELKGELKTDLGVDVPGDPALHMCRQCLGVTLTPFYRPNISGRINLLVNPIQVPNEITTVKFNQGKAFMSLINDEDTLYKGNVTWGFGECQNYKYLIDLQALNTTTGEKNLNARIYNSENAKVHDGGTGINKYFYTGTYISEVEYNNVWHDTGIFSVKKAGDVILEISGKGKVEFIVVADGVTVDDYTFEIYNHSNKFICGYSSNDPLVRPADGSGFCSILLPYGDYQLHVHADGYTTESGNKTSITYFKVEEDTEFVDVELIKNICRGYLVDRVYGNGVAYADVRVLDEHGNVFEDTSSPIGVFTTDLTGNGKYQIEIKSPYYYPFEEQFIVTKGKYDFKKIELDPLEDASLSGRFVNVNGQPVVGVTIYAKSRFDDSITNTESDADGYFQLSLPDWGIYDISYESEKYIANNYTSIYVDRAESLGDIVLKDIPNFSITHTSTDGITTDILAASPVEVYNGIASMTWTINSSEPWKIVTNRGDWFSLSVDGKSVGLNSTFDAGKTELKLNISKYTDSRNDGAIAFEVGGETRTVEIFQEASHLKGWIVAGLDQPINGAVVTVSNGEKSWNYTTGANGVFDITVPNAYYTISVRADGYESKSYDHDVQVNGEDVDVGEILLTKSIIASLTGTIKDGDADSPTYGQVLEGVSLDVYDSAGKKVGDTAKSNENGIVAFDFPAADTYKFVFSLVGYETVTVDTVIINENTPSLGQYVMMRAEAKTSISGTTSPGTKLELLDENGNVLAETIADEDGRYEFTDIPGWDGTIFRIRIKDTTVTVDTVGGATGVAVDTTVTIFTVSTPDTVQIDNEVGATSEWEIESSHPWTVTKSGDTSWYTLNMESGNAGITNFVVTASGTTDSYRESTLTFALNNRTFEVTIYQNFVQTVSGSVVEQTENSDEVGIENVVVVVRKAGDSSLYSQVETDVNGQYTLIFEDAGEYVMTYSHPEYNTVTVEGIVITADLTAFDAVEMVAVTNTVTGVITNIDGTVMEGVTVTVSTEEYPDKSMTTGADGKFTFTLPIGWYDITITKNSESEVYRSHFNIEDTSIDVGTLTMPLTLEGTVNDNENPIVNATVTLIDGTTGSNIETTQSDDTGTFRFKFYTEGTYYLKLSAAGYSEKVITDINITKDASSIGDFSMTAIDITASGTYENLTWEIDASGTLSISGTGEIPYISYGSAPWYNHLSSVTSIVINEGITGVDFEAFNGKYQYSTISLPSSVTELESIYNIYQAEFVVDEDNQYFMTENGVLFNADQTILLRYAKNDDYSVPSGVIVLDEYAFTHSSVGQLDLPNTLQVIGNYAFYQSYITELNIPASVINIRTRVFKGCDNLQNIHVSEENLHYESDNGVLFLKGKQTLIKYPGGRDNETYCIPDGVTKVLEEAFTDSMEYNGGVYSYDGTTHVYGLQSITFPASVTSIAWDDYSSDHSYISNLIFLGACPDMIGGYGVPSDGVYPTPGSVIHYTSSYPSSSYPYRSWTSSIWQYESSGFAYPFKTICEGAITTVTGTVTDETGTALEVVRIQGYNSSDDLVSVAVTDSNGLFTIQFEEADTYRFTFNADGYEWYTLNDFMIDETITLFGEIVMKEGVSIIASGIDGSAEWSLDSAGVLTLSGTGEIGSYQMENYSSQIKEIVIQDEITGIYGGWYGYDNLQTLRIGSSLETMSSNLLNNETLACIEVSESNPYFSSIDGVLYNKDQSVLIRYPQSKSGTSFIIPDKVTTIGESAFGGCDLTEITIPVGVAEIEKSAFRACDFKTLNLPNSIVRIGDKSFYNCYALQTVEIPHSLTSIGADAFDACYSLSYFTVDSNNPKYCSVDGILFSKDMTVLICYPAEKQDVSVYDIPDSVISLSKGIENDYLTEINLGRNLADIGDGFRYCSNITAINVDAENTYYASLDGVLFNKSMDTLLEYPKNKTEQSYVIPDTVTTIAGNAFYSSNSLISIYVPDGVTTIEDGAMGYCNCLSQVYFYGNVPENFGSYIFKSLYDDSSAILYYISGKSGWTYPTWTAPDGTVYNTATWDPENTN